MMHGERKRDEMTTDFSEEAMSEDYVPYGAKYAEKMQSCS